MDYIVEISAYSWLSRDNPDSVPISEMREVSKELVSGLSKLNVFDRRIIEKRTISPNPVRVNGNNQRCVNYEFWLASGSYAEALTRMHDVIMPVAENHQAVFFETALTPAKAMMQICAGTGIDTRFYFGMNEPELK